MYFNHNSRLFQITNSSCLSIIFLMVTVISILNAFIYRNFHIEYYEKLSEARSLFLWWSKSNDTNISSPFLSYLLITCLFIVLIIKNMKDLYTEFHCLIGALTLWMTSLDFQCLVQEEYEHGKQNQVQSYKSINVYRKIAKLSRLFSKIHGLFLFAYLVQYILYYSCTLDELLKPEGAGRKLYRLQYIIILTSMYGLSSSFYQNVSTK